MQACKMIKKITDTEQIRVINRKLIIQALRNNGAMARVELCNVTNLSPATITAITSDLFEIGFLKEVTAADAPQGRGRPKVTIDLNANASFVIGIQLSVNELAFFLGDLKGEICSIQRTVIQLDKLDEKQFIQLVIDGVKKFVSFTGINFKKLSAIAIAMQGPADSKRGIITWSPALSIRDVPICAALEDVFQVPTAIANDCDIVALAINHLKRYEADHNLVTIVLDFGVGMGALINGQLYSGSHGAATEFGHVKLDLNGPQCRCGGCGCIEAYASDYALYRESIAILGKKMPENYRPTKQNMDEINVCLANGNAQLQEVYDKAGFALGLGLSNLVTLLDPERIVITGPGVAGYKFMQNKLEETMKKALPNQFSNIIEIYEWQEDLKARGVIQLALDVSD